MMWALIYVLTISFVAAALFLIVDRFEPNRRLALVLKFLNPRSSRRGDRKTVAALVSR